MGAGAARGLCSPAMAKAGRARSWTAVCLAAAVVIAACTAPPTTAVPSASPGPVAGGRAVVHGGDPATLSPVLANDAGSAALASILYRGLLASDATTGAPGPSLAERWEVTADGRTLTFHLRDGLRWSDGAALTGDDFAFTVEAVMRSAKTVRKSLFHDIVGIADFQERRAATISGIAVDGSKITVRLAKPLCPALSGIGTFPILPRHVFGRYADGASLDSAPENDRPSVASGPFRLREREAGKRLIFVRNERYHGVPALLDEVEVRTDAGTAKVALLGGLVDVASFSPADVGFRDDLRRSGQLNVLTYTGARYTYIGWNQLRGGKEFFRSKAVRQALAYGLDIDAVLDKGLGGEAVKMLAHTLPRSWAYDPSGLNEFRYAPARAEELLRGDGWAKGADGVYAKGGQRLAFSITTFAAIDHDALLREAVDQYRRIGIEVTPVIEDATRFIGRLSSSRDSVYGAQGGRDFDAFMLRWVLGPDPDPYDIWHSGGSSNFVGYRNEAVDRALEDGRTKCSLEERRVAYKTVDRHLNDDQPYRFAFALNSMVVSAKHLQGLQPATFGGAYGTFWNVEKWWVKR